ncbi:uncharacterized protein LOC111457584 isoform X2 [Cucurbita moschata]|uniref:Uncharacterized protein LOC111457584 isoform X2 n=1 Tax=Cucurbita moschata TaxID=3662 RepID=A0A6J1GU74_CUCMO|nr:uncharacterized protein LOC111457584 isoform X2 [Cucurbita moschata]
MAEFLWTFAVQELLKKTASLAAQQIGLAWGFKKDLLKMRDSLLMLHAILRDVDRIKSEYPEVKPWVEKLQDIVFEADVLLDDLAYERLRRKVETGKDAMRLEGDDVTSRTFPSFRGCGKLRSLKILGCENLSKLRDGLEFCSSVENLWISYFSDLNLQNMRSLSCLSIRDFQKLPNGIASLLNLKDLSIHGDLNVYDWGPLIHLRSLENLVLVHSGSDAAQLPQELEHLTTLRSLHISHFDDVEALPEWFGNFTSLEILKLYNCRNLKNLPSQKALSNLVRLSSLRVYGCSQLELGTGCFEQVKTSNGSIKFVQEIHTPFYWALLDPIAT